MAPDRPSLEERLRAAFAEQVGEHPLRADLVASAAAALPDRSGAPASGWLRMALPSVAVVAAIAVVAAFAVLTGLNPPPFSATVAPSASASGATATWPAGVIPWIDASPTPSPAPSVPPDAASLPACTAADLVLVGGGWEGLTGGQLAGGAYVINLSQDPCTVAGMPRVDLLDANGRQIAPGSAGTGDAPAKPVVLASGGVAIVGVAWGNWCGPHAVVPLRMRLTLSAGQTVTGPVRLTGQSQSGGVATEFPGCLDVSGGSTMPTVWPFAVSTAPSTGAAAPCVGDQLAAFTGAGGAAAGTEWTRLVILNLPGFSCTLPASPTLELRDAGGTLLATAAPFSPDDATLVLPAAGAATTIIGLANWCGTPPQEPLSLDLRIGSAVVPVTVTQALSFSGCGTPGETPPPDFLYGGALALPNTPPSPEEDPADSLPMTVELTVPASVAPGETLQYTVTLTDHEVYGKTDNLAFLCPNYTQRLILADGRQLDARYALNCASLGRLGAGDSVTWGMQLVIPADAPQGATTVTWILGDRGPAGKATLRIATSSAP